MLVFLLDAAVGYWMLVLDAGIGHCMLVLLVIGGCYSCVSDVGVTVERCC